MLYSIPVPEGAVTTIVPFEIVHVGCTVTEAVGVAGLALASPVIVQPLVIRLVRAVWPAQYLSGEASPRLLLV